MEDLRVPGCGTRVSSLGRSPPLKCLLWTAASLSGLEEVSCWGGITQTWLWMVKETNWNPNHAP